MAAIPVSWDIVGINRMLWIVAVMAYAVLLFRLYRWELLSRYQFFSIYLVYRLVRSLVLFLVPYNRRTYAQLWVVSSPLTWFLYILVVLELYSLVLKNYKGIASLGRWTLTAALVVAVAISAISLIPDFSRTPQGPWPVLTIMVIERGVISGVIVLLLLLTAFLVWYPVPLTRNVVVYTMVYAAYFISSNVAILVNNLFGQAVMDVINLVLMAITVACLFTWIFTLNRKGEERTVVLRSQWNPGDEDQLVEQLAAINASLLRAARK